MYSSVLSCACMHGQKLLQRKDAAVAPPLDKKITRVNCVSGRPGYFFSIPHDPPLPPLVFHMLAELRIMSCAVLHAHRRKNSPPGQERALWYSSTFGDWDLSKVGKRFLSAHPPVFFQGSFPFFSREDLLQGKQGVLRGQVAPALFVGWYHAVRTCLWG